MKKKFFILKIFLVLLISLIIGIGVYSWNVQVMQGRVLPMPFGVGFAEVLSDSMAPTYKTGDILVVVRDDEYEIGDVVAFQDNNMVVAHRIIGENENGTFITKGDWVENSVDPTSLKPEYIFGKVETSFSGLGGIVRFFKSPIVSFALLALAGFLFVLSTKKEKKEKNKDVEKIRQEIAALKGEGDGPKAELSAEEIQAQIDALKLQMGKETHKKEEIKKEESEKEDE